MYTYVHTCKSYLWICTALPCDLYENRPVGIQQREVPQGLFAPFLACFPYLTLLVSPKSNPPVFFYHEKLSSDSRGVAGLMNEAEEDGQVERKREREREPW